MKQIKIKIEGMTCGGCVSSVQKKPYKRWLALRQSLSV